MSNTQTATKTQQAGKITTPEFRVSFPSVFKARAVMEGQDPKYSLVMLFRVKPDPDEPKAKVADLTQLNELVKAAVIGKWGTDPKKWPRKGDGTLNLRLPIRKGEEKDYDGYGSDIVFATASSKMKPALVDGNMDNIIEPGEFCGGDYAYASVTAFAYDVKGNRGVAFGLRNIQKIRDGERFSGAGKPEDDFDKIEAPAGKKEGMDGSGTDSDPIGELK